VYVNTMLWDAYRNPLQAFARFDGFTTSWNLTTYCVIAFGNLLAAVGNTTIQVNAGYSYGSPAFDIGIPWALEDTTYPWSIGDSTTAGSGPGILSYRYWLGNQIEDAKPILTHRNRSRSVGTLYTVTRNQAHDGVPGASSAGTLAATPARIAAINANTLGGYPPSPQVSQTIPVLWIGINDIVGGVPTATILANIVATRALILAAGLTKQIRIAQLPPASGPAAGFNPAVILLNAAIATLADATTRIVDFNTGFVSATMAAADGIHLTTLGDQFVANVVFIDFVATGDA
jgi:hypothetical protein